MNNILAVVFSYNRPLQLDLLLKSFRLHCKNKDKIDVKVLYKAGSEDVVYDYKQCSMENGSAKFIQEENFQHDLGNIFIGYEYIMFLTDDSIFTKDFDIEQIINVLVSHKDVLGFSLRLGRNLNYCYSLSKDQPIPTHAIENEIMFWDWRSAESDWNYPLEVSSSVYRMGSIIRVHEGCAYQNPNYLEFFMDNYKKTFVNRYPQMACYPQSVCFSAPINKVSTGNNNNQGNEDKNSVENLLSEYRNGLRIDPNKFDGYVTKAAHEEINIHE